MSLVKVMVHSVWCTRNRQPLLNDWVRPAVLDHIRQHANLKDIYLDVINGHTDHVHALIGLNATMSISKVMQLIKGESAFWINRENLISHKFEWANEYFAVSVSPSEVDQVREYINDQESHHQKESFEDEWTKFVNGHKLPS